MVAVTPGTVEELDAIAEQVIPPAVEPVPPPAAAVEDESVDGLIAQVETIAKDPNLLGAMSEDEIALFLELVFGLTADWRGPEWEMPAESKSAKRIATWLKKSFERHGGMPDWLAKWFPDIMAAILLAGEVSKRWKLEKTRKGVK